MKRSVWLSRMNIQILLFCFEDMFLEKLGEGNLKRLPTQRGKWRERKNQFTFSDYYNIFVYVLILSKLNSYQKSMQVLNCLTACEKKNHTFMSFLIFFGGGGDGRLSIELLPLIISISLVIITQFRGPIFY